MTTEEKILKLQKIIAKVKKREPIENQIATQKIKKIKTK